MPAEKLYKLFDGNGLFLAVLPSGVKSWRIAYRIGGKQQTKSFGPYPEVTLAQARVKRDELRALLRSGIDPMAEKKSAREIPSPTRKWVSLKEASDTYWQGRKDLSAAYVANAERAIAMHLSRLLDRDIGSITRADLLSELQVMDAADHHVYVRKVRMWVGQVFEWAVEHDLATINPSALINPRKAFGTAVVENFAAIEPREMPDLLQRLELENDLQSVLACKLLALTWVRTTELRMMCWSEINGDSWTIPAGKMKRKRDHVVPLSKQALRILEKLKNRSRGSVYVFPGEHRLDRPMSENAVLYLLHRIGYKGRMTGHGFRSVASTWANELGYTPDSIERQLAHVPENKVRSAYNRSAYIEERRKMLQDYADWIDSCYVDSGSAKS